MKNWLRNLLLLCALGLGGWLGCPIYELTGITSPLCGTTRALLSGFGGDFIGALRFHPLFLLIPGWFLGILIRDGAQKKRKWLDIFLIGFAAVLFVMNILRWTGLLPLPG